MKVSESEDWGDRNINMQGLESILEEEEKFSFHLAFCCQALIRLHPTCLHQEEEMIFG